MSVLLSLIAVLALAPEGVAPDDDPVRAFTDHPEAIPHVRRAIELSAAEQDEAAVQELERAAEHDDSWRIAFLRGRALRNAGRCEDARVQHLRVIDEGDDPALLDESRLDLTDCGFDVPEAPAVPPDEPSPDPLPDADPGPPQLGPSVTLTEGDVVVVRPPKVGPALLGVGGGLMATGLALAIVGSVRVQGARDAPSLTGYDGDVRSGQVLGGVGWGVVVVGTALVGTAVALIAKHRGQRSRRQALARRRGGLW